MICGWGGLQVSAVAFDPYWEAPTPDTGAGDVTTYRFGSVGQVHPSIVMFSMSPEENCCTPFMLYFVPGF